MRTTGYPCVQPEKPHSTVPKQRASTEPWEERLRKAVREQHPFGYSIRPIRGQIQVQRYWLDTGKRETAMLPLEWHKSSQRDLLNALDGINKALTRGLGLKDAVRLVFDLRDVPNVRVNWSEVLDLFRRYKIETGDVKESTWDKEYKPRLELFVEQLNSPSGANDATKALEAMRVGRNGQGGEPGSRGRKLRVQYAAQMLRFAVDQVGLDQRWQPPKDAVMKKIVGKPLGNAPKAANAGQAHQLTDSQFLELFDSITNPSWKLAVGILGVFGLRGVELNYVSARGDGLHVSYKKNTAKGATKPRLVPILDPIGRPGLGRQLLLALGSGIVELPPLGTSDADASSAISVFLRRNETWKRFKDQAEAAYDARVSVYSLRHLFAWRCATTTPPVNPRAAAVAMGHSYQVHVATYSQQVDLDGVKAAFAAANQESTSLELHTNKN